MYPISMVKRMSLNLLVLSTHHFQKEITCAICLNYCVLLPTHRENHNNSMESSWELGQWAFPKSS